MHVHLAECVPIRHARVVTERQRSLHSARCRGDVFTAVRRWADPASRLLAHAEAHAPRDGTHRFLAKPLDLDALVANIGDARGRLTKHARRGPVRALTLP